MLLKKYVKCCIYCIKLYDKKINKNAGKIKIILLVAFEINVFQIIIY